MLWTLSRKFHLQDVDCLPPDAIIGFANAIVKRVANLKLTKCTLLPPSGIGWRLDESECAKYAVAEQVFISARSVVFPRRKHDGHHSDYTAPSVYLPIKIHCTCISTKCTVYISHENTRLCAQIPNISSATTPVQSSLVHSISRRYLVRNAT